MGDYDRVDSYAVHFFSRISRVRKRQRQNACLHAGLSVTIYDEQRERGMRSISSLLIRGSMSRVSKQEQCSVRRQFSYGDGG